MNKSSWSIIDIAVVAYCFLLAFAILSLFVRHPIMSFAALGSMLTVGTVLPGNPTYGLWMSLKARVASLRAKAPAQAPGTAV